MSERWQTDPLGKYCYIKARIGWRGLAASEYRESGPFLIAGKHIESGRIDWDATDHISEFRYNESSEIALAEGDVILSKDGTIGRVARIDSLPGKATINGTMMLVRPVRGIDYRFLYHVLNGAEFKKLIDDKVSGSSIPHIFQRDMVTLPVSFPPIAHQTKLAEVLDTLDTAIHETEAIIAKLKAIKQGLLHDLLTRGIAANGELRPPQAEAPHLYKPSPLGWIPKEWDIKQLAELLGNVDPSMRSGPFGSALLKQELVEAGFPLLGIDNVHAERFVSSYTRFVTPTEFAQLSRYAVRPDDLMITIIGTVGRCCLVPDDIGQALSSKHTWTISLNQQIYSPYLAMLQVNFSPWVLGHFARDQQGGTMAAIRSETLRSTRLPAPPRTEQRLIEKGLRELDKRIDLEVDSLAKRRSEKTALSDDLLTGRVRVTPLLEATAP
ncbi:restriction endonuclease subunit S [Methylococcus sp. Mc7]|uniref:restriction endonuclease subunit S n=1 Tax=Methylococcus sp. Mc7 TaxID=2860258 RepID=UPI001C52795E|nr:restriction endonuclease subunit S [Methylococcus sp. Mc7]QXP85576.1 restriction endonuclease subunit S [Methylococcus sp. Mc7]